MKKINIRPFVSLLCLQLCFNLSFARNDKTNETIYFNSDDSMQSGRMVLIDKVIGYGTESIDTIEIYTDNPLLFFNDNYVFGSASDIVVAYPNAEIYIPRDWYDAPVQTTVTSEYGDILNYICNIHNDNLPYNLLDGKLLTNNLMTISKFFRIGSTLDEVNEFLGLSLLGIPLKIINHRTIIISHSTISPKSKLVISNSEFLRIIVEMVKNKIVSIRFEC